MRALVECEGEARWTVFSLDVRGSGEGRVGGCWSTRRWVLDDLEALLRARQVYQRVCPAGRTQCDACSVEGVVGA